MSTVALSLLSISLLLGACGKKTDYTCVCTFNGHETETPIANTTKAQAKIACDALETYADLDCELK